MNNRNYKKKKNFLKPIITPEQCNEKRRIGEGLQV